MRWLIIYIALALILNIFATVLKPAILFVQKHINSGILFVALPVSKGLDYFQNGINNYLILISTQKENNQLKKQLIKCELLKNSLLKEIKNHKGNNSKLLEASFSFKGNFDSSVIFLRLLNNNIDLKNHYCMVLTDDLSLVGLIKKKIRRRIYQVYTVFNPLFSADAMVISDNITYKALYMGSAFSPKVEFLDPNVSIKIGAKVYTSGEFGVFAPRLFIGKVIATKSVNGYYKVAYLNVRRDFFNKWKLFILCKKKY